MKLDHEFTTINTIIDKDNKPIKSNIKAKSTYYLDDIRGVEEMITSTGGVYKDRCQIYHKDAGEIVIYGKYENIRELVFQNNRVIGYGNSKSKSK